MKSGLDTIIGYVEIGTAGEMYFERKVKTMGGGRREINKSFIVKGVIRKPGGFTTKDALVMEIHELGKNNCLLKFLICLLFLFQYARFI